MGEHVAVVKSGYMKHRKHRSSLEALSPKLTDQEFDLEQDETGKEMGYTVKESKHSSDTSDPVGGTSTQECEHTVVEEEDQAYSLAGVEGKEINIGSTSIPNYSSENIFNTAESEDNIIASFTVRNNRSFDDVNPSALEKEPAAVSKNIIAVKHPQPAWIIFCLYMQLIFIDCQINAALIGTMSCIFCTYCFVTYKILLSFILALFRSRCRLKASLLNTLILSLCQLSRELLAIVVFCVCAKEVPVKDADDLKKGQHLTRPGQSPLGFLFYRHHLLLKDIVVFPDKTAMLTLIHYTKCGRQIDIYETVEPYVPGDNVNVVQYGNPKYPPEAIIEHAESSVNFRRKAKLDSYSLLFNNCESVITEFMVGSKLSLQTLFYFQIILMFVLCIVFCFTPWYITMFTFVVFFYLLKLLVHEFKYILQLR